MNILARLSKWIFPFKQAKKYELVQVENLNRSKIKNKKLYLEVRGGKEKWLYLKCPDECGDLISVNLMQSYDPSWTVLIDDGLISIHPSVWKKTGCKSHFFIKDSAIVWASLE
jgi:hypothetical protein